jgi:hypothetical protein
MLRIGLENARAFAGFPVQVFDVARPAPCAALRIIFEVGGEHAHLAARRFDDHFDHAARHAGRALGIGRPGQQVPVHLGDAVLGQQQVAELARQVVLVDLAGGSMTGW